jgi:hypothetical protein
VASVEGDGGADPTNMVRGCGAELVIHYTFYGTPDVVSPLGCARSKLLPDLHCADAKAKRRFRRSGPGADSEVCGAGAAAGAAVYSAPGSRPAPAGECASGECGAADSRDLSVAVTGAVLGAHGGVVDAAAYEAELFALRLVSSDSRCGVALAHLGQIGPGASVLALGAVEAALGVGYGPVASAVRDVVAWRCQLACSPDGGRDEFKAVASAAGVRARSGFAKLLHSHRKAVSLRGIVGIATFSLKAVVCFCTLCVVGASRSVDIHIHV